MKISLYFCCLKNNKLALANFIACLSPLPPRKTDVTSLLSNQSFKGEPRWWVSWIRSIWRASGGTKNTVRGQQKTYTTRILSGFRGKKPYFHWLKPFLVSLQRLAELLKNISTKTYCNQTGRKICFIFRGINVTFSRVQFLTLPPILTTILFETADDSAPLLNIISGRYAMDS